MPRREDMEAWVAGISDMLATHAGKIKPSSLHASIVKLLQAMLTINPEARPTAAMVAKCKL